MSMLYRLGMIILLREMVGGELFYLLQFQCLHVDLELSVTMRI